MYKQLIKRIKPVVLFLFAASASLLMIASCTSTEAELTEDDNANSVTASNSQSIPVRVTSVKYEEATEILRFAGVTRPRQRANLSFQVSGNVQERYAEIGERVNAGDIVARLYNPTLEPAAEAAEARLAQLILDTEQAERDLVRFERIYKQGLLAVQDLEKQRTLLSTTKAAVENARAVVVQNQQLQRETELVAPFSGRIEQVLVEPGEFAQAGEPAIRISAESGMEIEVRVPPHILKGLDLGKELPVWHGLTDVKFSGQITEISEGNSGDSALYPLIVGLEDNDFKSGEALEVGINLSQGGELSIPLNAILRSAEGIAVFKLNESTTEPSVSRVIVDVKRIAGDRVLIAPGALTASDQVVYAGITRLADGDSVHVLTQQLPSQEI